MKPDAEHTLGILLAVLVVAVLVIIGAQRHDRATVNEFAAKRDTIVDTIRVTTERVRVDTVRVRVAEKAASVARLAFDSVAKEIESAADTATSLPVSFVIPGIQSCRVALDADSVLIAEQRITINDALHLADLEHRRADLAEQELKHARPRFGFRAGILAGASLALTVIHLVR